MPDLEALGGELARWAWVLVGGLGMATFLAWLLRTTAAPTHGLLRAIGSVCGSRASALASMIGTAFALTSSPVFAVARGPAPPRSRVFHSAKPRPGTEELSPPRSFVPSGPVHGSDVHPAIHGQLREGDSRSRLFGRVEDRGRGIDFEAPTGGPTVGSGDGHGGRSEDLAKELSKRRHPAGRALQPRPRGDHRRAIYKVEAGDSLWSISAAVLGTDDVRRIARFWPQIHRLNRNVIGKDPSLIFPGQLLELPDEPGT